MDTHFESASPRRLEASGGSGGGSLTGDCPEILARITDPGVGMAIWERDVPASLKNWLGALAWPALPSGRVLIELDEAEAALSAMLSGAGTPECEQADLFIADVAENVARFSEISESNLVDVRVDAVKHDACWRFHQDCVPFRLITTYLGPGTEYVGRVDGERALRDQKAFGGAVHRVPRFAVSIFKGSQDVGNAGVVHRSPPIVGTGLQRLVLCLNTPSITSPPRWRP